MNVADGTGNGAAGHGGVHGGAGAPGRRPRARAGEPGGQVYDATGRATQGEPAPVTLGGAASAGSPFRREGLATRALPFAGVAVLAEASLALPPGPQSGTGLAASLVLLAAALGGAALLPWQRLPSWAGVLVPLAYTGSVLGLIEAAGGTNEGLSIILLVPVVWTALFHRPWESACVVLAAVAAEYWVSVFPDQAPVSVIVRRLVFWGALAMMIALAGHGLRARIRRSQAAAARLQARLRELSIMQDRDRIASSLQDTVVQRLFAAGLSLQSIGLLTGLPDVRQRLESAVHNLDEAIRLLRQSIFGLQHGLPEQGLRRSILDATGELTSAVGIVPEITLDGPIDTAIPPQVAGHLLTVLREALAESGSQARATRVSVAVVAGQDELCLTVTDNGSRWQPRSTGDGPPLGSIGDRARRLGGSLELSAADGGAKLVWRVPLPSPADGETHAPRIPGREPLLPSRH